MLSSSFVSLKQHLKFRPFSVVCLILCQQYSASLFVLLGAGKNVIPACRTMFALVQKKGSSEQTGKARIQYKRLQINCSSLDLIIFMILLKKNVRLFKFCSLCSAKIHALISCQIQLFAHIFARERTAVLSSAYLQPKFPSKVQEHANSQFKL